MRQPEFWQAFLSLDLSHEKSEGLLELLGTSCSSAEDLANSPHLNPAQRAKLAGLEPLTPSQAALLRIVSLEDAAYPENLRNSSAPPQAIMVQGELRPEDRMAVAIVGTRKASAYGRAVAHKLASEIAKAGVTVVSGAAHGIDAQAHLGALEVGGRTIAVMGSGLDRPYPSSNRRLLERVAAEGAVISQFALGTDPDWWRFPVRNCVIAGLSRAVIVVEAPETSGSLHTATAAAEEGRHVFATPGPIHSIEHRGSFRLINDGATLLYTPDQVFAALSIEYRAGKVEKPPVTAQQRLILDKLTTDPELVDNLSETLDMPAGVILAELTKLEIGGLVTKSLGGYVRI